MNILIRSLWTFCIVLTCVAGGLRNSFADTRVALVIGNGAYQHAPQLPNPPNDATDVAAALKRAGFDTILATDLNKDGMDEATIKFARAARSADVAMFYYSGHAMQFAGVNYLAPVDADLQDEADLRRMTRVDDVVADLSQAKNLRILVLDSCRDNPLAEQLKRSIGASRALSLQRGLAKIESPEGMIVAYATQAGRTAEDGDGHNSPYTTAFLKHIDEKEEIGSVFRRVSADVYDTTKHQQLPELSLSLIGEFYLRGKIDLTTKPEDTAARDFEAAERVNSAVGWDAFLKQHPDGFYAALAREKQAALASHAPVASSKDSPPQTDASKPQEAAKPNPPPSRTAQVSPQSDAERIAGQKLDWDACNEPNFQGVDGCTRIIDASNETPHRLAIAFARRAAYYGNNRITDKAIADMSEAIRNDREFPNWWYARALQYENAGQLDLAISDLTEAIRLREGVSAYYGKRASIYEKKSDRANALADYRKALNLDASNKDAEAGVRRLKRT